MPLRVAPRVLEVRHERLQLQGGGPRLPYMPFFVCEARKRTPAGTRPPADGPPRPWTESAHPEEDGEARRLHLQAPPWLLVMDVLAPATPALVLLLHEGRHVIGAPLIAASPALA